MSTAKRKAEVMTNENEEVNKQNSNGAYIPKTYAVPASDETPEQERERYRLFLEHEVMPAYEKAKRNPGSGLTADELREHLAQRRARLT